MKPWDELTNEEVLQLDFWGVEQYRREVLKGSQQQIQELQSQKLLMPEPPTPESGAEPAWLLHIYPWANYVGGEDVDDEDIEVQVITFHCESKQEAQAILDKWVTSESTLNDQFTLTYPVLAGDDECKIASVDLVDPKWASSHAEAYLLECKKCRQFNSVIDREITKLRNATGKRQQNITDRWHRLRASYETVLDVEKKYQHMLNHAKTEEDAKHLLRNHGGCSEASYRMWERYREDTLQKFPEGLPAGSQ